MNNEIKLELLKMATQLACATISQNKHLTKNIKPSVENIFNDCLAAITEAYDAKKAS